MEKLNGGMGNTSTAWWSFGITGWWLPLTQRSVSHPLSPSFQFCQSSLLVTNWQWYITWSRCQNTSGFLSQMNEHIERQCGASVKFQVSFSFLYARVGEWTFDMRFISLTQRWPFCVGVSRWSDCALDDAHVNATEDVKCAAVISRSGISCVSLLCAAHGCPGRGDLNAWRFFSFSFLFFSFLFFLSLLLTASSSCLRDISWPLLAVDFACLMS